MHKCVPFNKYFYFIGFVCFIFYAAFHILRGNLIIASISIINVIAITFILVKYKNNQLQHIHNDLFIALLSLSVIAACYELGSRGIIYIFPVVAGYIYYYKAKVAIIVSTALCTFALIASLKHLDYETAIRTLVPIMITVVISFLYAKKVEYHQTQLRHIAKSDHLTGLYNRRKLISWLKEKEARISRNNHLLFLCLGVDNFKHVNDQYGHSFGDYLLQEIASKIEEQINPLRAGDKGIVLSRVAGDEFIVGIYGVIPYTLIKSISPKLLNCVNNIDCIQGVSLSVDACVGLTTRSSAFSYEQVIKEVHIAMYEAKKASKNQTRFYSSKLAKAVQEKLHVVELLKNALLKDEFYLVFMPVYGPTGSNITGAEALIRTHNDALSSYTPDIYIPIAEEHGLIHQLDEMVIRKAFKTLKQSVLNHTETFSLAINISSQQLKNKHFATMAHKMALEEGVDPRQIEFELTETALVDFDQTSIDIIKQTKAYGFSVALDDFGTGYTAFSQLRNFPVDTLKIDRSFTSNIDNSGIDQGKMVDVILSLAHLYNLNVVAEGVENSQQLDYLKHRQCDSYQGYYLSKPISWSTMIELIEEKRQ
ncbi:bifunctional diguanylate cyclase/phosphodiesterase [Pseudoalteromonas sp. MMG012]|uniref:putative bifunctional diguanylate cyclase/phosphodiesterase n=1 Tax=Pseudoalteromonas sp. MMG012 TaxID=2822686 RepID=UPI001B3A5A23|nr:GGDEF domain-containing phosphodiesterase [Pseudoalteromonas sp. MMG012]MBQ4850292.1 EAL domain-containing protein [Pseudoalteromonas sp. MMG012]